jgi:hypothetical protein
VLPLPFMMLRVVIAQLAGYYKDLFIDSGVKLISRIILNFRTIVVKDIIFTKFKKSLAVLSFVFYS